MNEVLTLIWKEYRCNLHLLIVGVGVLFFPVLVVALIVGSSSEQASFGDIVSVGLVFGTMGGVVLSQFMMLCLGGHLICGERSTRTFEFLFNQPVSRYQIMSAKLIFAILWKCAVWALAGAMLLIGFSIKAPGTGANVDGVYFEFFVEVAAFGAMLFGSSWLASNKVASTVLAMAIGAISTTTVFVALQLIEGKLGALIKIGEYEWTRIFVLFGLSVLTTIAGSVLFIRRRSP